MRFMSWIKIEGITSEEDGLLATAMGADAVGFVFAPSRRQVSPQDARDIRRRLPPEVATIGVFRDEAKEQVVSVWSKVGLSGIQLHGREPHSDVRWIRERVPFVIRAFAAGDPALARAADAPIDAVLVDSPNPGSGRVFDWTLAEGAPGGVRLILAGGLNPDNVAEAIQRVRPWGVDVATGVEAAPGVKDERKLRRFIAAAREGFERLQDRPRQRLELDLAVASAAEVAVDRPYDWDLDGD
jgi:phosphoribosylanthranilate isomerase